MRFPWYETADSSPGEAHDHVPSRVHVCSELLQQYPTRHAQSQVQVGIIPAAVAGRDCIGVAETGSGKTAAFVLPILHQLCKDPYGVFALILSPTRYDNSRWTACTHDLDALLPQFSDVWLFSPAGFSAPTNQTSWASHHTHTGIFRVIGRMD